MRRSRLALVQIVGRAAVLVFAPIAAATEPQLVRDHGAREVWPRSVPIAMTAAAPAAAGFEAGVDVSLRLRSGYPAPFGKPNAWVYLPSRFDGGPLSLVVVFRGFKNCIASYTSPHGTPCTEGKPQRTGYDLPRQAERSGTKALVVVPELAYDTASSEAGPLGEQDGLRRFLTELVEEGLTPLIGSRRFEGTRVTLMASSGGYQALEPALAYGGVDVREVVMLDGFYLYEGSAVARFLTDHVDEFRHDAPRPRRLTIIYTPKGGALEMSEAFRYRAREALAQRGLGSLGRFDGGPPSRADLDAPVVVMEAKIEHDEIVSRYLWQALAASARAGVAQ